MNHEESHLLLPADSAWLALERPDNPMTITVMMRVEGLTTERFLDFLQIYWLAWERFRYYPVRKPAGWWWERDTAFSLRHHLQVVPEQMDSTALQQWVSALLNQPLPDYRPRWKFWLAPGVEGGAAVVLRMHHCYADGLSLMSIFDRLCPPSPQQAPVFYGAREQADFARWGRAASVWLRKLAEEALGVTDLGTVGDVRNLSPARLRQFLEHATGKGYRVVNQISQFLAEPEDSPNCFHQPLSGRRQCCWSEPFSLERLRLLAGRRGVKVNDLVLQLVTAGLRARLAGDLEDTVIHVAMPVDIREQLPEGIRPGEGGIGNYFGTVFVPLPVDGDSSLERLYRIKHETRKLKRSWQPGLTWGLASSAALMPDGWRQLLTDLLYRKASAVVSNVPGTPETRYLAGCRILEQMFWVPQASNIGLGISIVSYADQVQIGVVADEAVLANPLAFLDDCLAELFSLEL